MIAGVKFSEQDSTITAKFGEIYDSDGYARGYEAGHTEGYDKGHIEGVEQGYENGYKVGEADGEVKGRAEGEQIGFSNALEKRTELTVAENGEYIPEGESTGFSKVNVNVPKGGILPQVIEGTITEIKAEDLSGITAIGNYAFYYCSSLTKVELPNSITQIGNYGFYSCRNVKSITLSNNLVSIGNSAFEGCLMGLSRLTIPASVTTIGTSALRSGSTSNKSTITFLSTTPPTIASSTFKDTYLNRIIVPKGCGEIYKSATNWSNFADYIKEATE
jgi:hypothetical protein